MSGQRPGSAPGEPSHQTPSELRRAFARSVRQARQAAGLTQQELAEASGCSPRLLGKIETNAANVKLDTITRLAKSLGLTEIDLLRPDLDTATLKRGRRAPAEPLSKTEPSEFRRRFARNLRERREATGRFQKALAAAAGMPLSAEGDIEVNAVNVTLDTVTRLAQALGVTEIDLLGPNDR